MDYDKLKIPYLFIQNVSQELQIEWLFFIHVQTK